MFVTFTRLPIHQLKLFAKPPAFVVMFASDVT
jgi:hypothetical protein